MGLQEIDPDSAWEHLQNSTAVFVDVRDPQSFQAAHIPGAVAVSDQNVQDFIQATEPDATVIVYCYHGHMSQGGATYFRENGLARAMSLREGFEGWRQRFPTQVETQ